MKCNKCGNELKTSDKFCTKCGTSIENSIKTSINENNYTIQKNYDIMWGMVGIIMIIDLALWLAGVRLNFWRIAIGSIIMQFVIYGILAVAGAFANLLFKCPNCKEEITLNQNILTTINDNELTHKCPKCSKELIFNNKDLSVRINDIIETVSNNANHKSNTEKLEELYNLKTKGIISEEEFEKKKQELLNKI